MKSTRHNGIAHMILASLFFSFMGAFVKYISPRVPAMESVFFRALITFLMLTPWMRFHKIPLIGKNIRFLFLRGSAGFTALALNFYVTSKITLADSSLLNQTSTFFVALLAVFYLKEKVTWKLILFIGLSFIGAGFIVKPSLQVANIPGVLGLVSGLFAAIAYIAIKELHKTESFFTMVWTFSFISSLGSLFFLPQFVWPNPTDLLFLAGIGFFGTIAQLLMTYAYKHAPASEVNPYSFATVIFSALWGMIFWAEIPDHWSIAGAVLIIGCGVGIMRLKKEIIEL